MTYEESVISALDDVGKYFRGLYHEEADPETYAKYYSMMSIVSQASNLIEELMENEYYGKTWRCWSAKPTEEQREATPWQD